MSEPPRLLRFGERVSVSAYGVTKFISYSHLNVAYNIRQTKVFAQCIFSADQVAHERELDDTAPPWMRAPGVD